MSNDNENEMLRINPVFKSLTRPQLIAGGDRTLVIVLLVIAVLLMGPGGLGSTSIINFVAGIFVLLFGLRLLNRLGKYDPYAVPIFKRAMRYKGAYAATSGFLYQSKPFKG